LRSATYPRQADAHPEGFGISVATGRMFVNVPVAGKIVMVDLASETIGPSLLGGADELFI